MNTEDSHKLSETEPAEVVTRHRLPDRIYHWTMAVTVFVLLGTSFLPIVGIKFSWVLIHWVAGVILSVIVLIHIVRALFWQDRASMGLGRADIKGSVQAVKWVLRRRREPPDRPGKYPLLQKLYHHVIAVIILTLMVTGGLMMAKIDTPFWQRNPYFLSSDAWGWVYIAHDLTAMVVLAMVMIHIYFAIRPEKLWITKSMIVGWITRQNYLKHHDPEIWQAEDESSMKPGAD